MRTRGFQTISYENEKVFVCSYGAQVEPFKPPKNSQQFCDTIPLSIRSKTCKLRNLFFSKTYEKNNVRKNLNMLLLLAERKVSFLRSIRIPNIYIYYCKQVLMRAEEVFANNFYSWINKRFFNFFNMTLGTIKKGKNFPFFSKL